MMLDTETVTTEEVEGQKEESAQEAVPAESEEVAA